MRIEAVKQRVGSRRVTNRDLLDEVRRLSAPVCRGDLDEILKKIDVNLSFAGAEERRWLGPGETPIELACDTISRALEEARIRPEEVDLIIHAGIGRGFIEPGQAHFIAHALGWDTQCFDLVDACNGWTRAMFVAQSLFKAGGYRRILIVNTECNMIPGGVKYPTLFEYDTMDKLTYSFTGLTSADGVAVTIVSPDGDDHAFRWKPMTTRADLCVVPIENYQVYSRPSDKVGLNGKNRATSFPTEMDKILKGSVSGLVRESVADLSTVKWFIPHGYSWNVWLSVFGRLGVKPEAHKWNTFKLFGNLASACAPIALAMGIEAREIQRGHRIMTVTPSAGMQVSTMTFVY
jgi:3-oxoacyl-[acyl-carrier-protein] synthase III